MKNILVTGGLGFIGSHTCVSLLECGHKIIIVDSNITFASQIISRLKKIGELKKIDFGKNIFLFEGDIRNKEFLNEVFNTSRKLNMTIDAVIHFAGLKSVRESVNNPLIYWDVNVCGSLNLFEVMNNQKCKTLVFSSSATVYGINNKILTEDLELRPFNPYGFTKATIENILKNIYESDKKWRIANLRYFNPVGSHISRLIFENPKENFSNLFPSIMKVLKGKQKKLFIYGNNWPTKDGTCIRDFIHVSDLAQAHIAAIDYIQDKSNMCEIFNIGTGNWYSVLQIVNRFNELSNNRVPYEIKERREGDIAYCFADCDKAKSILKWKAKKSLNDMINDCIYFVDNSNK